MPLLDTSKGNNNLDSRFVADLVLQILSYVANKELEANKARREAGYAAMGNICKRVKRVSSDTARNKKAGQDKYISNKTGRAVGRPEVEYPTFRIAKESRKIILDNMFTNDIVKLKGATAHKVVSLISDDKPTCTG